MKSALVVCAVFVLAAAAAAQIPPAYTASVAVQYFALSSAGNRTLLAHENGTLERWADGTMLRRIERQQDGRTFPLASLLRLPDGSAFRLNQGKKIALALAPPGAWPPPVPAGAKPASWNGTSCLLSPVHVSEQSGGQYVPLKLSVPSFLCYSPRYTATVHSEVWRLSPDGRLLETIEDTFDFVENSPASPAPRIPAGFTIIRALQTIPRH